MKMKYFEVQKRYEDLLSVKKLTLPRGAMVAIARNIMALSKEIKFIESQKLEIAEKFAKKDENQKIVVVNNVIEFENNDSFLEFRNEFTEMLNEEVDVEVATFGSSILEKCDESDRYDLLSIEKEMELSWMIDYSK